MSRQDFIDQLIIKGFPETEIDYKLSIRDKFTNEAQEQADIDEFIKGTKYFIVKKLSTPFGDCKIIVPKDILKDLHDYMMTPGTLGGYNIR